MKIYKVISFNDAHQCVHFEDCETWPTGALDFEGVPRLAGWHNPETGYILDPRLKDVSFRCFLEGSFVIRESLLADAELAAIFGMSAELLPVQVEGEPSFIVNVLTVFDALDMERTEWKYPPSRFTRGEVGRGCFRAARLGPSPLFKIPLNAVTTMYCLSDHPDVPDFHRLYHERGYTGLTFEEQIVEP